MTLIFRRASSYLLSSDKLPKRYQSPDSPISSLSPLLNACETLRNLEQIHAHIIRRGADQDNLLITKLVCLCNSLSETCYATTLFDCVSRPNIYLWNSILKGYSERSLLFDTLSLFKRMKWSDASPDCFTFPSLLKACSHEAAIRVGIAVHCAAVRYGVEVDIFVATGLVDFYGKCREIEPARKVFDAMCMRNEVTWTAMIVGYVNLGEMGGARELFDVMPNKNIVSWNAMIGAHVKWGDLRSARKLFDEMPERNVVSFTTMIAGYAKAGDMASARFLFDHSPERDIVAWSSLISGYAQNGHPDESVNIFLQMHAQNVKPDEFIMVGLMSACSQVGSLELAKWVDSYLSQTSIDLNQAHVISTLIDMNAKCGNMERAMHLFEKMAKRDLISYCSMIQGLSISGSGAKAVELFRRMQQEGLRPDAVAFTVVLTACSHAGLVDEGCRYFTSMQKDYGIIPSSDHYACMVDLLGRAGRLKEAYGLIKSMPIERHAGAWGALLGACRLYGNVGLGEIAAAHLFDLEPHSAGNFVSLSNIYADANRWSDVSEVRNRMRERGVRKVPGCSWISFCGLWHHYQQ